jgi:CheY-like chemotaxis protein
MTADAILVIDDNPQNLRLARLVLRSAGFDVHTASDAEEALIMLETLVPALIVTDVQLPGLDGLELTRRLKADARHQRIPVLALTAYAMKGDDSRAFAAGCDGYLAKPIDADALPRAVAQQLVNARSRSPQ